MKVVIVAKTRMGSGACIGGLTFTGRSVRLIAADQEVNEQFNMEYGVGEVWDVDYRPDPAIVPPHVENIIVTNKIRHPSLDALVPFIEQQMPPSAGGLEALFGGLTQATKAGAMYIAERTGVPPTSTMFWRPDQDLIRVDDAKRIRYQYPNPDGRRTLTFVGFQEPPAEIPAGTLLRVSLAHWWRPDDMPEGELRCYVQLSGWFLPQETVAFPMPDSADFPFSWDEEEEFFADPFFLEPEPAGTPQLDALPDSMQLDSPQEALKRVFGFDSFRPLQEEIITQVLDKEDVLAVMPTGSGKSLCFQLPALLFPGLTVVVSPLIALMQDQVEQLRELGIPAVFLNSTLSYPEYLRTTEQIRAGRVKLLYAAPETLLRPETLLLLEQCPVDCLTIDEAHCISEWGHDFRPEYRQLAEVRRRLPDAVCVAVTATATERVRADIKKSLGIPAAGEFLASFDRENLFLAIAPKTGGLAQTLDFLQDHQEESGIIYCATRKQVDLLAGQLQSQGHNALPYHAGLDAVTRRQHQRQFTHDDAPIIVATIAFGMGIDKSNVRYIMHYDLPKNLESYYQQIGRAGRDGLRADCMLLYSYQDVSTIQYFINQQDDAQQRGARVRLDALLAYVEAGDCRRRPLLNYFGEAYPAGECGMCDNCLATESEREDLTIPAQKFLSCVKRTGELFGMSHIIDVLRGSQNKKVLQKKHDRLSTYNIGGEFSQKEWQFLARQFIQQGLLVQDAEYGSLKLTPAGVAVFKGEKVEGRLPEEAKARRPVVPTDYDRTLFSLLRDKRKALAEAAGLPPYVIFADRTLIEMATYYPQSRESLSRLYGVGEVKLNKYADAFLPIIQVHCQEQEIEEKQKPVSIPVPSTSAGNRTSDVAALYNSGQSIADIAASYGVQERTVVNHLWKAAQAGEKLRPGGFLEESRLSPEKQEEVWAAFDELGVDLLRPVYEALNETVPYDELNLMRLHLVGSKSGFDPGTDGLRQ
jgi:ATP-dependent DNA helicase RecQ